MIEMTNEYLESLLETSSEWEAELEAYALEHHVPIMEPLGIEYLQQLLRLHQPKRILEVGTAIGYSALKMNKVCPDAQIVTMERDEVRYDEAVRNIKRLDKEKEIHLIFGDALEQMEKFVQDGERFDFVFIDAAKGQYGKFFELAHALVPKGGLIVTDNVLFRGYVADDSEVPKKFKNMVKKLKLYNEMLMHHSSYSTVIMPIGDGVASSIKLF
ncbi:O-methyltransferase [Aciduricibacillus chroicocephali]|uniref:tRNA 5-hydroxyuridine methyltransferase n=1 Tax=Aciduricibacillus chroicocephali TaxID=3054939 RepID=A0ABY9KVH8_9BACI|nr:O-methyltransferase [Bacillaceae bacterium 44XB]